MKKNLTQDFLFLLAQNIEQKKAQQACKTAENYATALRSFRTFLKEHKKTDRLPIGELSASLLLCYEHWLQHGVAHHCCRNTTSAYMRVLRAVYNRSVRLAHRPDLHPFDEIYTGVDETRKRAADATDLARLFRLDLSEAGFSLRFSRDLFCFSLFVSGISFIDICKLTTDCVLNGHLEFERSKTHRKMSVCLTSQASAIIKRYHKAGSKHLFPILSDTTPFDQQSYGCFLGRHNRNLLKLERLAGLKSHLTSYVARHTWASQAYRMKVPLRVISESLGHRDERVTTIYLKSLDHRERDAASKKVSQYFMRLLQ